MKIPVLLLALAALPFSGCLQIDAVVKLKPDGTGTIEQKVMMGGPMVAQMKAMSQAFGGDKPGAKGAEIYDEAKVKAQAAEMGEGVTFVSGKKETGADGSEGFTAVYAFTDINKVKLKTAPNALGPGGGGGQMKIGSKETPVTFQFTKGRTAELTINTPRPKDAAKPATPPADDPTQDAMMPMMQQMLKDMSMKVTVEVAGKITETNAKYQDGSRVTLMDVEMNKVMADPAKFKAMTKIKEPNSPEAKALLATVPGIRVETAETVKIKFQ